MIQRYPEYEIQDERSIYPPHIPHSTPDFEIEIRCHPEIYDLAHILEMIRYPPFWMLRSWIKSENNPIPKSSIYYWMIRFITLVDPECSNALHPCIGDPNT